MEAKLPPHLVDIEEAVLSAALVDKSGIDELFSIIRKKEVFYKPDHQYIFSAMENLFRRSEPIDLLTVSHELKKSGNLDKVGGEFKLVELKMKVSSAAHLDYHARLLLENYVKRELIVLGNFLSIDPYKAESDVFQLLDESQSGLDKLNENFGNISSVNDSPSDMSSAMIHLKDHVKRISESENVVTGIPSGITAIDELTNGWQNSDLIIQAARPGMGKTSLAIRHALAAAQAGYHVSFFSIEMNELQIASRMLTNESSLHTSQVLREGFKKEKYWKSFFDAIVKLEKLNIKIQTPSALNVHQFRMQAKMLKRKFDTKLIIVDYLQLMSSGQNHRDKNLEVESISKGLKAVAKELNIPVIALSQLSRSVESRGGHKRPKLSDLRDSGAIEQDADLVMFTHRPEYYGDSPDYEVIDHNQNTEFIFAKHRNGPTGIVGGYFDANKTKFIDCAPEYEMY